MKVCKKKYSLRPRSTPRALNMKSLIPWIEKVFGEIEVSLTVVGDDSITEIDCDDSADDNEDEEDFDDDKSDDESDEDVETNKTWLWLKRITVIQKNEVLLIVHNILSKLLMDQ